MQWKIKEFSRENTKMISLSQSVKQIVNFISRTWNAVFHNK